MRHSFIRLICFFLAAGLIPARDIAQKAAETTQKNEIRTLKLVECMRIDDGDEFFFQSPLQTIIAPDGSILVNEGNKLYRFDAQGKYIENLFRTGEGPGEMKEIGSVLIEAGRIIIYERSKNKIIELDTEGDLVREQKLQGKRFTDVLSFYNEKYYFVDWIPQEFTKKEGIISINHNIYAVSKDGTAKSCALNFPTKTSVVRKQNYTGFQTINNLKWAGDNSRWLFICHTPQYSIKRLDLNSMDIAAVIEGDYTRIRFEDSDERKGWYPVEFENDIRTLLLHDANLWVVTSTVQKNRGILVDVYSSEGNPMDRFYLPVKYSRPEEILFWSMTIFENDLFLFNENEDNTLSLFKYNIQVPLK